MAIRHQLRPYQVEVGRAVLESVLSGKGLTFSVELARQGGKNELSAQLEVLLLTLFMGLGGNAIKCAATFKPQTIISMMRLKERLNDAGFSGFWIPEHGYIVRLGKARQIFLSADNSANVVGATAHILLEVDESQDVSKEKYTKEFKPMGAATNVTTVLYGTAWDDATLLEEVKQLNLELERKDGIKRHFRYDWQEVANYNPDYRRYVEGEKERLGESHPLFLTQYCLKPLRGGGRFLTSSQRAQLQGDHPRRHQPAEKRVYVAGIDLAGEAEEGEDAALRALKPRQDSTVVTIGELDFSVVSEVVPLPRVDVVEHYWWTGRVASFLSSAFGGSVVTPFQFSQQSKSRLGFAFLAAINSGRVKMYAQDGSEEYQEFWREMERAKSSFRANQTMNFYVDPSEGHDDFLMSLALLVEAAEYTPRGAKGFLRNGARANRGL